MVQITDEAGELLLGKLQEALEGRPELKRHPSPPGLKLRVRKNGAHLLLSFPSKGDKVLSYHGRSVLIIAAEDQDLLADTCLMVRRLGNVQQLAIERLQPSL